MADGTSYPAVIKNANGDETQGVTIDFTDSGNQPQPPTPPITSGALPTQVFVSGTGAQILTTRQVTAYVTVTFDGTNNVASCIAALSPDDTTYSNVATASLAAAVNNTGAILEAITLVVPAGWFVKLTLVHATAAVTFA